ncbi:hypothetical protein GYMLUDRAFT_258713 [Collybiopsis luxurians FD-317 M1]|nr:hypothetical protein GYMLUDRAFT_258713 [Collybiopsis luxurians FD-317 M1]
MSSWTVLSVVTDVAIRRVQRAHQLSTWLMIESAVYASSSTFEKPELAPPVRTKRVVSRLIRDAIESASFASFFSVMVLITTMIWPTSTLGAIFSIPMGRVYTNTFLAILNSRPKLQRELHDYSSSDETDYTVTDPSQENVPRPNTTDGNSRETNVLTEIAHSPFSSIVLTDIESL